MTRSFVGGSVRRRLMVIIGVAILFALLLDGAALLIYDVNRYSASWLNDLQSQAEVVGRASIPALQFDDPRTASNNLNLLSIRPSILSAALYDAKGQKFAEFHGSDPNESVPETAGQVGHRIVGARIELFQPISDRGQRIGTVYIRAQYQLLGRMVGYLTISGLVALLSLLAALALSFWFQRSFTEPLIAIEAVVRRILETRDFRLRVPATTQDEIGYLAVSVNAMLEEVTRSSDALRAADRRKNEFLATLAHELRNPLSPLRNGLDILRVSRGADRPNARETVLRAEEMMSRQISQMARLIDDLLDVSRISTGKLLLKKETVEFSTIVASALDTLAELYRSRGHELATDLPGDRITLYGDPARLTQILINLLHNAAKYTPPGGKVSLVARAAGHDLTMDVKDNGIGMDEAAMHRIFEMFHQVDVSLERDQAGLGVGLTLARTLAELHGGRISAASAGLGQGTTMTVVLPIVVSPEGTGRPQR